MDTRPRRNRILVRARAVAFLLGLIFALARPHLGAGQAHRPRFDRCVNPLRIAHCNGYAMCDENEHQVACCRDSREVFDGHACVCGPGFVRSERECCPTGQHYSSVGGHGGIVLGVAGGCCPEGLTWTVADASALEGAGCCRPGQVWRFTRGTTTDTGYLHGGGSCEDAPSAPPPAATPPAIALRDVTVQGPRTADDVRRMLRRSEGRMGACAARFGATRTTPIELQFAVGADGRVLAVSEPNAPEPTELATCWSAIVREVTFPRSARTEVTRIHVAIVIEPPSHH
jgi:hypothetical protein